MARYSFLNIKGRLKASLPLLLSNSKVPVLSIPEADITRDGYMSAETAQLIETLRTKVAALEQNSSGAQEWTNKTGVRAIGVAYPNNTGEEIKVILQYKLNAGGSGGWPVMTLTKPGHPTVSLPGAGIMTPGGIYYSSGFWTIPPGYSYTASLVSASGSLAYESWHESRPVGT